MQREESSVLLKLQRKPVTGRADNWVKITYILVLGPSELLDQLPFPWSHPYKFCKELLMD